MPKDYSRAVRIADQIQRNLAQLIQKEIADPRLGLVNINEVEVSPDYANATVFVTLINSDEEEKVEQSVNVLNKASGFLRTHLAKMLKTRTTPRLHFKYDKTAVAGQRLSHLIDSAIAADKNLKDN